MAAPLLNTLLRACVTHHVYLNSHPVEIGAVASGGRGGVWHGGGVGLTDVNLLIWDLKRPTGHLDHLSM